MKKVTKDNLEQCIQEATHTLLEIANKLCYNKISGNINYIMTEITNEKQDLNKRKEVNDKKKPKNLELIILDLKTIYEELYDINLFVYRSRKEETIIEIKYYLKSYLDLELFKTIKNDNPMLHSKVAIPLYADNNRGSKKFDVNWELGGCRHKYNNFLSRAKYYLKHTKPKRKSITHKFMRYFYAYLLFLLWISIIIIFGFIVTKREIHWENIIPFYMILIPSILVINKKYIKKENIG